MDTSTTTCAYTNPVESDGSAPVAGVSTFQFASSTCVTLSSTTPITINVASSTLGSSAQNPVITQDAGSLTFGIALILFVLTFAVLGLFFTTRRSHIV